LFHISYLFLFWQVWSLTLFLSLVNFFLKNRINWDLQKYQVHGLVV
jgi:hypothetical protein